MKLQYLWAAVATFALAGCGTDAEPTPSCSYASGNLLEDPGFNQLDAPRRDRKWLASAHVNTRAFTYTAEDGTLTINQVASEPWFLLSQSADATALAGKTVEFTSELKLDLTESMHPHNFKLGGGLALLAKKRNRVALGTQLPHEPHMGTHDWFTARLVAEIPRGTTYLRLSYLHQAGGSMQARNPSLRIVEPGCPVTVQPNS